jgi:hypothetical protein
MEGTTFKIKADGSGYTKTLKSMRGDTEKFSSDVKGQMAGIGGALKAAFAYVGVSSLKGILDEVTELGRLARTLGDDFEGFQTLTNAARQFGVEAETVADALKDLNVRIQEGAVEGGSMAEEFAQLGLDVGELSSMMPIEQFYALSDAIQNAGGNMKRMGLDRINDAMFRLGPLAELGAKGIKNLGNEFAKYTDAQREMAEKGSVAWDNMVQSLKWLVATLAGAVIPAMQNFAHTIGAVLGEGAAQFGLFGKGLKKFFAGDFAGSQAAFGALADYASGSFERVSQEIKDIWKDTTDEIEKETPDAGNIVTKRTQETKDKLEEEVNKQLAEQEKRRQSLMDDEEKLLDIQKKRIAAEKELGELGERLHKDGATDEEALQLEEAKTKWQKLQTEEQKLQLDIQKKKDAEADSQRKKDKSKKDKDARSIARSEGIISDEQEKQRQALLSDEEKIQDAINKRMKLEGEFASIDALSDPVGKAAKGAELEKAKTDEQRLKIEQEEDLKQFYEGLEILDGKDADKADLQTSIISSSLASVGGGGGTATFGNDPMLSESKKQSNLLEQLVSLQGGTIEGGGNLVVPEL